MDSSQQKEFILSSLSRVMSGEVSAKRLSGLLAEFDLSLLLVGDLTIRKLAMIWLFTCTKMIFLRLQREKFKFLEAQAQPFEISSPLKLIGTKFFLAMNTKSEAEIDAINRLPLNPTTSHAISKQVLSYVVTTSSQQQLLLGLDETRLAEVISGTTILIGLPDPLEVLVFLDLGQYKRFLPHIQLNTRIFLNNLLPAFLTKVKQVEQENTDQPLSNSDQGADDMLDWPVRPRAASFAVGDPELKRVSFQDENDKTQSSKKTSLLQKIKIGQGRGRFLSTSPTSLKSTRISSKIMSFYDLAEERKRQMSQRSEKYYDAESCG